VLKKMEPTVNHLIHTVNKGRAASLIAPKPVAAKLDVKTNTNGLVARD